jgi:hypothetical protein
MRSKLATIVVSFVVVVIFTAGHHDKTILRDDFNDGDSEGWDQNDFTVDSPGGPGIYHVVNGRYVLESTGAIPVDDPSVGAIEF